MKSKIRLLSLVVSFTLILLTIGAILVVLGIFNEALNWDIFGPKLEALLYGVFGACMSLAGFGVAMAVIIAMQESVRDFKKFVQSRNNQEDVPDASKKTYASRMLGIVAVIGLLVGLCSLVDYVILTQRCKVFKRLAAEQIDNFQPRIVRILSTFTDPPQNNVPPELYDVVKTLDNLEFINTTTLYIPDPSEASAMWGFTAWRDRYTNTDGFARFYIAKDFEKALRKAIDGYSSNLSEINARNEFIFYKTLEDEEGKTKAVIRIDGNSHQSFREYKLGQ